ncbi:toll/interleukin-1 receptor domain-containing protein [Chondrinema litorale]|uniref:toll/interleukin-1 receptor domain-containing protein n=1 Tax=Chondrinema litorale TaxID=2994555 RepID=UPI002543A936|nr:toll/interleukin-1 receptor domain-containing protein [Chondrinema litorale]UZR97873.1 toll/interleukin-1 receptor domain-containing protein [Chondrinema litorale]
MAGAENTYLHEVFISYAWGGESESFVNELQASLEVRGLTIVRDKTGGLDYRGMIKEFMEKIGDGNYVITIISNKYLRSENCMFELMEIAENGNFHDRIYPVILEDAQIFNPVERLEYVKYWEDKIDELEEAIKTVESTNLQGISDDKILYEKIRSTIAGLMDILRNMNTLTPQMHRQSGFEELFNALDARVSTSDKLQSSGTAIKQQITESREKSDFTYDIFLSFGSEDASFSRKLGGTLRAYGFRVFMSNDSLSKEAGKSFFDQIDFALKSSHHFLLVCTPNSMDSGWVKHEYQAFFNQFYIPSNGERRLMLMKGEGFSFDILPTLFTGIQVVSEVEEVVTALTGNDVIVEEEIQIEATEVVEEEEVVEPIKLETEKPPKLVEQPKKVEPAKTQQEKSENLKKEPLENANLARRKKKRDIRVSKSDLDPWMGSAFLIAYILLYLYSIYTTVNAVNTPSEESEQSALLALILGLIMSFIYYFASKDTMKILGFWLRILLYAFLSLSGLFILEISSKEEPFFLIFSGVALIPASVTYIIRNKQKVLNWEQMVVKAISYILFYMMFLIPLAVLD